jgi:creatinine amidohydrolase
MEWQRLSTHDHARLRFTAALLPVGTVEAHGPGPVGTDNLIPAALAERLSLRLDLPVLPLMPYGVTASLLAYPGGCTLSPATLEAFLFETGRSLRRNGLRHLFVLNGHGGNTAALGQAAQRLFRDEALNVAVIDWWWEVQKQAVEIFGEGGMGHSAVDELGMLLGLQPEAGGAMPREPVPSFYKYKGLQVYPSPRPVITYERPDDAVDLGRLTPERCARFAEQATDTLELMIREILEGWEEIGR